ncbi:GIY-YIG nuclease family protein [Candidatus Uhrbacteria bacterium]|nr:GIY-YIG nuclease family protein [Candidatus Uhrbacteria bacterium]
MPDRAYSIYILTNAARTVLYIGMTNDLVRRIHEHRTGAVKGFTKKYHCDRLVYYEQHTTAYEALAREKALKGWTRKRKLDLVQETNVTLRDLWEEIIR